MATAPVSFEKVTDHAGLAFARMLYQFRQLGSGSSLAKLQSGIAYEVQGVENATEKMAKLRYLFAPLFRVAAVDGGAVTVGIDLAGQSAVVTGAVDDSTADIAAALAAEINAVLGFVAAFHVAGASEFDISTEELFGVLPVPSGPLSIAQWASAEGVTLDTYGEIVGERRAAVSDEDYIRALQYRIFVNVSKGAPFIQTRALAYLTQCRLDQVEYKEIYPASFQMYTEGLSLPGVTTERKSHRLLPRLIKDVAPAGCGFISVVLRNGADRPFRIAPDGISALLANFDGSLFSFEDGAAMLLTLGVPSEEVGDFLIGELAQGFLTINGPSGAGVLEINTPEHGEGLLLINLNSVGIGPQILDVVQDGPLFTARRENLLIINGPTGLGFLTINGPSGAGLLQITTLLES